MSVATKLKTRGPKKTAVAKPARPPGVGRRGPLPWQPTDEERAQVENYVALGYTQEQIAGLMGKSIDILAKYCRRELDNGVLKVNGQVGGKLFQKCMAGDTTALIFWAKTRMGWKEPAERVEVHMTLEAMVMKVVEMRKARGAIEGEAKQITKE